jgi:acetolactate synthase-1/2/3 large subunit
MALYGILALVTTLNIGLRHLLPIHPFMWVLSGGLSLDSIRQDIALRKNRAAVALIGDGGFSTNPSVIATAMEASLSVVWLVMDNAGFGTIAGLESMHYGWSFGCMFERCGKPYAVDYAAMARSFGARGVMITAAAELGAALAEALASNLPTVIQAPMENAPTPTPGHWDINAVYRRGD